MDEQAQQVIGQLQLQVQQQQAQLQQQHSHQVALLAQLASSSIPMSAPPLTSRPVVKPKPPSTFLAGDKTGELDQWEREMRYQFVAYGHALSSGEARIAFAASYLGPVPLQWWDATASHRQVQTWEEFVALLRARFRPVHAAKQARTELFKIKQTASQTAGAYASSFQQLLVSLPDMHVDDQVFLFVRGLLPALRRRVGDKEFATLSSAVNAAVQSEGLYGLTNEETNRDVGSSSPSASHTPMDINALEAFKFGAMAAQLADVQEQLYVLRSSPSSGWTLEMEGRRLRGECFGCGQVGHRKSACPTRR